MTLRSPYSWFGGKSRAASIMWERFGDVPNFVDPFLGSLALLLQRENYDPHKHLETVNDRDCYIANFWRAIAADPEKTAFYADHPVNEADLHARHLWLVNQDEFRERMLTDPDYCDFKIAGWWVWGLCCWIGSGWCHLENKERGVPRQLPHLGNNGRGVHRKRPHLGNSGQSSHSADLYDYFVVLSERLRRVRVCCGDWTRVLGESVTVKHGVTAIALDPPYSHALRDSKLYSVESDVSAQVREWAIANGGNPLLRIALFGYADEHDMPEDWECVEWHAAKGYNGNQNLNRTKERIWFSPHCLQKAQKQQLDIFDLVL